MLRNVEPAGIRGGRSLRHGVVDFTEFGDIPPFADDFGEPEAFIGFEDFVYWRAVVFFFREIVLCGTVLWVCIIGRRLVRLAVNGALVMIRDIEPSGIRSVGSQSHSAINFFESRDVPPFADDVGEPETLFGLQDLVYRRSILFLFMMSMVDGYVLRVCVIGRTSFGSPDRHGAACRSTVESSWPGVPPTVVGVVPTVPWMDESCRHSTTDGDCFHGCLD